VSPFKFKRQDSLKVFFINFSDIEGRLDPLYYYSVNNLGIVNHTRYPVKKLSEVIEMQRGRFGHRPRNEPRFYGGEYPFIQTGDIVRASKTNGHITFSQTLNELGLKTSRLFSKPVVVITIAANIGDTAILDYPACFPDSLIGLTPKTNELTLEYINLYFKFIKTYLEDLAPQSAQKNINYQQLSPVPIVIPPLEVQQRAVQLYHAALIKRQGKEQQAQVLLVGIDVYLLAELGITLPQQDSSLEKRIFLVSSKEIINQRLDPYYFQEHFIQFTKELDNSKYKVISLKNISQKITSGVTPLSGGDDYTNTEEGIPFIRSGNINIDGNIDYSDLLLLKPLVHNSLMKSSKLIKGDLMIAIVGATIGQVGIYLDEREANINQAIALVRLNNNINNQYVKEIIKSSIGQMNLNRLKRPVARANINLEEISTMKIVLPPIDKQNQIAAHIENIRSQAKQLQIEASQILADAKAEVERMILGE
jgi:restriction endonuclease S subunit